MKTIVWTKLNKKHFGKISLVYLNFDLCSNLERLASTKRTWNTGEVFFCPNECVSEYFSFSPKTILIIMQMVHNWDAFLTVFLSVFSLCDPFSWFANIFLQIWYDHINQEIAWQCQAQFYYRHCFMTASCNVHGASPDFPKHCSAAFKS